jgi:hypothetical protein
VADVGALDARATVSVVVFGRDPDGHLPLTLAALGDQSYPRSLTNVVVEIDASEDSEEDALREAAGDLELQLVPERAAARAAEGQVLVLVPAGALPERELVEAHARWHHAVADAVAVGASIHVEAAGLEPQEVRDAQRSGGLEALVASRLARHDEDQAAFETFLERTHGLTERRPDLFRVAARGTVSLRSETLRGAGEPADVKDAGLARLDLAYRLDCGGCVFVPERAARSYSAYPEPWPAPPGADEHAEDQAAAGPTGTDPRVGSLIPVRGFRPRGAGRMFDRAVMIVNVAAEGHGAAEILDAVDSVLRGRLSDLSVRVLVPDGHPDRALLEAACAADPRVDVGAASGGARFDSPYQVTMPVTAVPGDETLDAIHARMSEEGLGALHVTLPGWADRLPLTRARFAARILRRPTMEVVSTGALARARRVAAHEGDSVDAVLARLFEEQRAHGSELGLRRHGFPPPDPSDDGALGPANDLAHERAEHLRHRARAATSQARADREAQRLFRERLRSGHERIRADRLEARLARASPSYWVAWKARRVARRGVALPKRVWARIRALRQPLYRLKIAASERMARRRG